LSEVNGTPVNQPSIPITNMFNMPLLFKYLWSRDVAIAEVIITQKLRIRVAALSQRLQFEMEIN